MGFSFNELFLSCFFIPKMCLKQGSGRRLYTYAIHFVSGAGGIEMNTSGNILSNSATLLLEWSVCYVGIRKISHK
jgi:hypothetical protein